MCVALLGSVESIRLNNLRLTMIGQSVVFSITTALATMLFNL